MSRVLSIVLGVGLMAVVPGCAKDKQEGDLSKATGVPMKAPATQPALYERMGGQAAMRKIVDDYVAITSKNPAVNFFRKGTEQEWKPTAQEVEQAKQHMVQFFALLAGHRDANYTGQNMAEAHKGMRITGQEFEASLGDLRQALARNNISPALQEEFMKRVDETRRAIVEVPR